MGSTSWKRCRGQRRNQGLRSPWLWTTSRGWKEVLLKEALPRRSTQKGKSAEDHSWSHLDSDETAEAYELEFVVVIKFTHVLAVIFFLAITLVFVYHMGIRAGCREVH